ncbi:MAG: site-specific integrase [Acidobacteriota bacterium]|nr:site-specific integrase [Acidobacteriota bacterium]
MACKWRAPGDHVPSRDRLGLRFEPDEGKNAALCRGSGQDYLRPAAIKAGVIPAGYRGRFSWQNLRHSLAIYLADNNVSLPVIQCMLRHARPTTTALHIHRVNATQMATQGKFLEAIKVAKSVA